MDWIEKNGMEIMKDAIREIHTDDKKLSLPNPQIKSYWGEHAGGYEIAEYSPETVMDFCHALEPFFEEDEKKAIMPVAIEIMNCGIKQQIFGANKENRDMQEDELEIPEYIYVF